MKISPIFEYDEIQSRKTSFKDSFKSIDCANSKDFFNANILLTPNCNIEKNSSTSKNSLKRLSFLSKVETKEFRIKKEKPPFEIIFNLNEEEKFNNNDKPFLLYDHLIESGRDFSEEDGYFFHMSMSKNTEENIHPKLKILICVTIFSESLSELLDTIKALYKNVSDFEKNGIDSRSIAVIVLFDGVQPISSDIREKLFHKLDFENNYKEEQTLFCREKIFLEDLQKVENSGENSRPINSCYIYEWNFNKEELLDLENSEFSPKMENKQNNIQEINHTIKLEDKNITTMETNIKIDSNEMIIETNSFKEENNSSEKHQSFIYSSEKHQSFNYSSEKHQSFNYELSFKNKNPHLENLNNKDHSSYNLKVFLAVKLKNSQKISSLVWFLRGFSQHFQPEYCIQIDCGTIPTNKSLWKIFENFEGDPYVGGICGYLSPKIPAVYDNKDQMIINQYDCVSRYLYKLFDIKSAQVFEYSLGHIMEKSCESLIGFLFVLPGAFSAIRWEAIKKTNEEFFLDNEFLKSVFDKNYKESEEYTIEKGNMFLAEDQIISFDIVTKSNCSYITKYIPDAVVLVDPVKTFPVLMKQRKRWINGSWFAIKYTLHVYLEKMAKTKHNLFRKFWFHVSMLYLLFQTLSKYFILTFLFIVLLIVSQENFAELKVFSMPFLSFHSLFLIIYIALLNSIFYFSFLCKPENGVKRFQILSNLITVYIQIFTFIILFKICKIVVMEKQERILEGTRSMSKDTIILVVLLNFLFYLIPFLLNFSKLVNELITNIFSFFFHSGSFLLVFQMFAFSNIQDLSWGTKAKENESQNKKMEKFNNKKITFTGKWILLNLFVSFVLMGLNSNETIRNYFIIAISFLFTIFSSIKFFGSTVFKIKYELIDKRRNRNQIKKKKINFLEYSEKLIKYFDINDLD